MRSSLIVLLPFICLAIVSYGQPTAKVEWQPGQSLSFKHQGVISGDLSDNQINKLVRSFK